MATCTCIDRPHAVNGNCPDCGAASARGDGTGPVQPARPSGIDLIAAERARQVAAEGWTPEHDDEHVYGELARAAACYATPSDFRETEETGFRDAERQPIDWPWDAEGWKPTPDDRVRELVKSGALIAAEIDRLQRAAAKR